MSDARDVGRSYPGGVPKYVDSASHLIDDSTKNKNPFDGYTAEIPQGEDLNYLEGSFCELESLGKEMLKHTAFALVGGGIGERLNSKYIKLSLTSDLVRSYSFLEDYCLYLHAIEVCLYRFVDE